MKTKLWHNKSGSTLVVVISIMATLMIIVGITAEYTTTIGRHVQRSNTLESAVAIGDSCIEILFSNWRTACRSTPTQWLKTGDLSSIPLPTAAQIPTVPSSSFSATTTDYYSSNTPNPPTVSNYKVVAADAEWNPLLAASATPVPMFGQLSSSIASLDPNTNPSIKTTSLVLNYIASADVTLPALGPNGRVVAKVRRVFQKQQMSPWNYAIFYMDPLEIHPGPSFTVTGWVHTNSDLYTGHNSLTFADKVTYGSDWFTWSAKDPSKAFKPGDATHPANDTANGPPAYPSNLPPARDQALQPFGMDSSQIFSTSDTNPNNDSYHELIEPPKSGYTDPLASSRYWDQAGVVIQVDASNNVLIGTPNADGTITSVMPPASGPDNRTTAQKNLYTMFSAAGTITPGVSTSNGVIQDAREAAPGNIRLATLDISLIETGSSLNPSYKSSSFNGIVYIYDASNTPSTRRGIRIKNGSRIPTSGLTIASNNPVYLQGDFNTGGTGSAVPSNVLNSYTDPANPPSPQVSGYTRAPCSIITDAINILSNSWLDSNSSSMPIATPTTVNTAVIAGIVPTSPVGGDGAYSGGAENFPRFLENWAKQGSNPQPTLTYYGSMVELFQSQQSIGEWGKKNVYAPPVRQWFFDTNFRTQTPPGSIMVYSFVKGKWSVL
jgi:hypothetical protein